jgi:hypothetical protein
LTPKLPPPPPRHAQNCVLDGVADEPFTRGDDDLGLDQLVASESVQPLAEADAATEREAGDAHALAAAMRDRVVSGLQGGKDIGVARAAAQAQETLFIELADFVHRRDVYEETVSG